MFSPEQDIIIERFDSQLRYLYISPSLTRTVDVPVDQLLGKSYQEAGWPESMATLWETAAHQVFSSGIKQIIEFDIPTISGIRSFEMILVPEQTQGQQVETILCISRDITERKQVEKQLQQQQSQKQSILSASSEGVVMHQADGQISFCNQSACQILGLTREQILGRTSVDPNWYTLYEDGSPFLGAEHPAMVTLRTGQPQQNVIMGVRHPDQSLVWISINTQPLLDRQGHVYGVVASFSNITDRKHYEQQLSSQVDRLHLLSQITQSIRQSLDPTVILSTTVREVRHLLQTDRVVIYQFLPDWSGQFIAESISDPRWSCLNDVVNDVCFTRNYIQPYESGRIRVVTDIQHSNFNPCHIQLLETYHVKACLIVPILQGSKLWGLLIAHHCTGPKDWETEAVELMTQIANQLSIAIQQAQILNQLQLTNDQLSYQIEVRNAELRRMVDYEQLLRVITDEVRSSLYEEEVLEAAVRELALGLNLKCCNISFFAPDQHTYLIHHEYTLFPNPLRGQSSTLDPDALRRILRGETLYITTDHPLRGKCTLVACPITHDQEVTGLLKLIRSPQEAFSISEIRLAEQVANQCSIGIRQARLYQSAQRQVHQLTELNQLKDEFVHMVSHELRTPLTNMKMALTLLEAMPSPDRQTRYFQMLKNEWQRELTLVNELLELLALESGNRQLSLTQLTLPDWIPTVVDTLQFRFVERNLQFTLDLSPDLPPLTTDSKLLERVLLELLNNACKYTPPHETVHLSLTVANQGIRLEVTNTGVQIPSHHLERIFDKFHRIVDLDRDKQGGTGLGLALVKKAIDYLGGQISVSSQDQITCFSVEIPCLSHLTQEIQTPDVN